MAFREGEEPGPLFLNFDRAGKGQRLTGRGLYSMIRKLGESLGIKVWPHGLRHAAITEALDLTNGNLRAVQRFSRHQDVRVLTVIDLLGRLLTRRGGMVFNGAIMFRLGF